MGDFEAKLYRHTQYFHLNMIFVCLYDRTGDEIYLKFIRDVPNCNV